MPTTSSGPTPMAANREATPSAARPHSAKVMRRSPSTKASTSPATSTTASKRSGTVSKVPRIGSSGTGMGSTLAL